MSAQDVAEAVDKLLDAEDALDEADADTGDWKAAEQERDRAWDALIDAHTRWVDAKAKPAPGIRVHTWDWKEQPDLEALRLNLAELGVYLREADTGGDQYAIAISGTPITQAEADNAYRRAGE